MIKTLQPNFASENGSASRYPSFGAENTSSKPLAEALKETIQAVVINHPATALASGFVLGGLLGWLLSRSK